MPNNFQTEVKFTASDLDEIIKTGGVADVIITCECAMDYKTGEWITDVTVQGKDSDGQDAGTAKKGCPMPCN